MVNNIRIAVVRIQLKNVGRTRIKQDYCASVAKVVKVRPYLEPIRFISAEPIDYSEGQPIFSSQIEIEPNEETYEDVAYALNKVTFFAVGVWFKRKGTTEAWQAIAVFNVDESAKIPSTADHLAEHVVRLE